MMPPCLVRLQSVLERQHPGQDVKVHEPNDMLMERFEVTIGECSREFILDDDGVPPEVFEWSPQ